MIGINEGGASFFFEEIGLLARCSNGLVFVQFGDEARGEERGPGIERNDRYGAERALLKKRELLTGDFKR